MGFACVGQLDGTRVAASDWTASGARMSTSASAILEREFTINRFFIFPALPALKDIPRRGGGASHSAALAFKRQ